MDNVLSIILGGGRGTRLEPLTKKRAKPAVPLGANYRLIDIPVSNCINSDINKIYCLTQFNSASLNRHLAQAYNASIGSYTKTGFVEVLAAQQSAQDKDQTEEKKTLLVPRYRGCGQKIPMDLQLLRLRRVSHFVRRSFV